MNGGKHKTLRDTTSEKQCHNCHAMAYRSRRRAQLLKMFSVLLIWRFCFMVFWVVVVGWFFGGVVLGFVLGFFLLLQTKHKICPLAL